MNERNIKLKTWLDEDVLLLERATLNDELGRPFDYQLDLLSKNQDIDPLDAVWTVMTVSLELPNGGTRYFNGYVTGFAKGEFRGDYMHYRATLRPWLWTLTRVSNCKVFQHMTVAKVVQQVCKDLGFTDIDVKLTESYRTWEFLVQYRETSFNFVSRLMEQEGIYYYFRHTADHHVMVLTDSRAGHAEVPGYKKIAYLPPEALASGIRGDVEHISRWQVARQLQPVAYTIDDFNFETPRATLLSTLQANAVRDEDSGAAFELYDYPGGFNTPQEGQQAVKVAADERRAQVEQASGGGNARGLTAGALFTLDDYPVDDQNKEHLIVSTSCALTPNLFESGTEVAGPEFECTFTALDTGWPFRTPRKTPKPVVQGPQTAIVVGEDGEEITTDEYGRVRLQFHWDRVGVENQNSSCWVRVAQVWAGQGWGAMHIPRIGQEVIVEFLEGDPARPIVTGSVYNADNMPPYKLPANKTQSGIKSRSTKDAGPSNFNEIRFEDKKGSEELHMQAEKDFTQNVKHNRSAEVGADDAVSVGGDRSVTVTGNLSVTVKGNGKSANHSNLDVTGKHHVKASDTIEIEAPTHIKLTCGDSSLLIEPDKVRIESGGKAFILIDKSVFAQAAASAEGGSHGWLLVADAVVAQSAASALLVLDSNKNVTIDGKKVQVTGSIETNVVGGAGSIKADVSAVEVTAPAIKLNG